MDKQKDDESVKMSLNNINEIDSDKDSVKKKKGFSLYSTFLSFFVKKMKEDKLYLLSFVIMVVFIISFSVYNISKAESLYNINKPKEEEVKKAVDVTEELDISEYVGIYSKEYKLDEKILYNDTCYIDSYKIVYRIKSDKMILKYFVDDCVGTVLMWSDSVSYLDNGEAKYVSANGLNYLFSVNGMKEVNGDSYFIDEDIKSIKHNQKYGSSNINFSGNKIIIVSKNDLVLVSGSNVEYKLSSEYELKTKFLDKVVYESLNEELTYKFIVFEKDLDASCYENEFIQSDTFVDGEMYRIYSISFDQKNEKFNSVKEIISRKKSDGCSVFDQDLSDINT